MREDQWPLLTERSVPQHTGSVTGVVAMYLPFTDSQEIDWDGANRLAELVAGTGLNAVFGADTGFGHELSVPELVEVCGIATAQFGRGWFGGVAIKDEPDTPFNMGPYRERIDVIQSKGGVPMVMQSYAVTRGEDHEIVDVYKQLASSCRHFLAHELGPCFNPRGKIYHRAVIQELMGIKQCIGLKYSGLDVVGELHRVGLRNDTRPGFLCLTGNDLAIDLFTKTGGWLLGAAAPVPEYYALRDAMYAAGDFRWWDLNAALQALAAYMFLPPIPSYRSSVAMLLQTRGLIASRRVHPAASERGAEHLPVLLEFWKRIDQFTPILTEYNLG